MRNSVFNIIAEFGESLVIAVGLEDRVVAETFRARTLGRYLPFYYSFKEKFLSFGNAISELLPDSRRLHEANHCFAMRFAVVLALQFLQQYGHVRLAVMAFTLTVYSGIARAVYSRLAISRLDLKTCVVGEARYIVFSVNILRLLPCVSCEGFACLRYVLVAVYVVKRKYAKPLSENFAYFIQLMLVVCCENYVHD